MGYYDEEFYDEPSEFEEHVIVMKEALAESIKEQFVAELERLRTENAELQTVKRDWESIQCEYSAKNRQLEIDRQNMQRTVRRERLGVLLKDFETTMYTAEVKWTELPKCDKCNGNRKVEYVTPLGRKAREDCTCADRTKTYVPEENVCSSFNINSRDDNKLNVWYKRKEDGGDDYYTRDSRFAEVVWQEGMVYDQLNQHKTFFKTREECQGYCDYLNSQGDAK